MDFLGAQVWEIRRTTPLRALGFILSFSHVLTFLEWTKNGSQLFNKDSGIPLCWEFFSQCQNLSFFSPSQLESFFFSYLVIAILAGLSFLGDRLLGTAWTLLTLCFFSKLYVSLLDASLVDNLDAVLFIVQFAFLFLPRKSQLPKWLLLGSFWILAFLKFDTDWMATFWLSETFPTMPVKVLEFVAVAVVFVEIFFPIYFILNSRGTFIASSVMLLIWSVYNYLAHDWVSAAMGVGILVYLWFEHRERNKKHYDSFYQSYTRPEPSWIWLPIGLCGFLFVQIFGWVAHSASTRSHPFLIVSPAVPQDCRQFSFTHSETEGQEILNDLSQDTKNCDEKLRRGRAKGYCEKRKSPDTQVSSYFLSRSITETSYKRLFESDSLCPQEEVKKVAPKVTEEAKPEPPVATDIPAGDAVPGETAATPPPEKVEEVPVSPGQDPKALQIPAPMTVEPKRTAKNKKDDAKPEEKKEEVKK